MRIWMDRCEYVLHKSVNTISFVKQGALDAQPEIERRAILERCVRNGVSQADLDHAEARIAVVFGDMEERLTDRPWLCGDEFSLADIAFAPFIERFQANKTERLIDWSVRPKVGDWWVRTQERPDYQMGFFFKNPDA